MQFLPFLRSWRGCRLSGCGRVLPPELVPWCLPSSDHSLEKEGKCVVSYSVQENTTHGCNAACQLVKSDGFLTTCSTAACDCLTWKCLFHVFPSRYRLKELQQQMVNVQREHTHGMAFRSSQRPSVFTGEKIIEHASLTQWYAICSLPQNWGF